MLYVVSSFINKFVLFYVCIDLCISCYKECTHQSLYQATAAIIAYKGDQKLLKVDNKLSIR